MLNDGLLQIAVTGGHGIDDRRKIWVNAIFMGRLHFYNRASKITS
jgi:hypothetical protein